MEYIKIFPTYKEKDEIIRTTMIIPKEDIKNIQFYSEEISIRIKGFEWPCTELPENEEKYLEREKYFERVFGIEEKNEEIKGVD